MNAKKKAAATPEDQALEHIQETAVRVVEVEEDWLKVNKLKTDDDQLAADEALTIVKKELDRHDKDRKEFVDPLNATVKRINARYKPLTERMQELERHLKLLIVNRINDLRQLEAAKAEKEARKAEKAGAPELAEDIREAALTRHVGAPLEGVNLRTYYSCKVVNVDLLPREYMVPDEKKLNALARALKGDFKVAGCELVTEDTITKSI